MSLLLFVAFWFNACKKPDFGNPQPQTNSLNSKVLIINEIPDSPQISLLVNNNPFSFNPNSYNSLGSLEQFRFKNLIYKATAKDTLPRSADLLLQSTFAGAGNYTLFLTDTTTRPFTKGSGFLKENGQGGVRTLVLTDDLTAPKTGNAKIRFLNISPNTQPVQLNNLPADTSIYKLNLYYVSTDQATKDTLLNFNRRFFREFSKDYKNKKGPTQNLGKFIEIQAGSYIFQIKNSGSAPKGTKALLSPINVPANLNDGKIYTIYLKGLIGGSGNQAINYNILQHN